MIIFVISQGDRSTTMTGMSLASSVNREDLSTSKKRRSSTADAIFEKEFKEKATIHQALKCKLKEI